jgi:hypothetical protein
MGRMAARVPVTVEGAERAAEVGTCVVMANHASYLGPPSRSAARPASSGSGGLRGLLGRFVDEVTDAYGTGRTGAEDAWATDRAALSGRPAAG